MKIKLVLLFITLSNNIIAQCINCGLLTKQTLFFDSSKNQFVNGSGSVKIYYKDSMAIVSSPGIYYTTVNNVATDKSTTKVKFYDVGYTFIDFRFNPLYSNTVRKKDSIDVPKYKSIVFYEYPAFSKDSFFIRKYLDIDTSIKRVGDHFYLHSYINNNVSTNKNITDSTIALSDTLIEGISYKRIKKTRTVNDPDKNIQSILVAYFQCDIEDWMIPFISEFDESGKCAFTRIDWLILNKQPWLSQRTEFLKRKLTPEEIAVFDAWEKNAKQNPLK